MKRLFDLVEPAMGIVLFLMVLAVMVLAACSPPPPAAMPGQRTAPMASSPPGAPH